MKNCVKIVSKKTLAEGCTEDGWLYELCISFALDVGLDG